MAGSTQQLLTYLMSMGVRPEVAQDTVSKLLGGSNFEVDPNSVTVRDAPSFEVDPNSVSVTDAPKPEDPTLARALAHRPKTYDAMDRVIWEAQQDLARKQGKQPDYMDNYIREAWDGLDRSRAANPHPTAVPSAMDERTRRVLMELYGQGRLFTNNGSR